MSSLYAKLIDVIERQITPLAGAIGQQKYVTSIRDGFITALPFMIVGSFLLVFIFPPFSPDTTWGFARAWLQFSLDHRDALMLPFHFSMGVMTLFIAVGIAASLAKHHHLDSLTAGMLSLMSFLLVAAPLKDGQISTAYFSGQGIFTAILVAIYSTELYAFLKRHNITIRLPPEVPAGVARSFEILIPVLAVGLCYGIETDVVQMVAQYIIRLLTARGELDSVLRAAFCHHPENYISLMEYYTPEEHGMEPFTRK